MKRKPQNLRATYRDYECPAVSFNTFYHRVARYWWEIEEAINTPATPQKVPHEQRIKELLDTQKWLIQEKNRVTRLISAHKINHSK